MDENELEKTQSWDLDNSEERPPVKNRRSIVSVAFPTDDLVAVEVAAEQAGKRLSEFIRDAAVEKVTGQLQLSSMVLYSGGPGTVAMFVNTTVGPTTRTALPVEQIDQAVPA